MEIIAHRGASYDAPENTLASVKLGWERAADAVEVDVHLSKDNKIVVIHDGNTKRVGGRDMAVRDQTLAQLRELDVGAWKGDQWRGERIPTLDQVIATIPDGKRLFVEIKCGREIVPELTRIIADSGKEGSQFVFISFSLDSIAAAKSAMPEIKALLLSGFKREVQTWSPSASELIAKAKAANLDGLDLNACDALTEEFVDEIRSEGMEFFVWTVNDLNLAHRMVRLGVDGITTDRPAWLRRNFSEIRND